MSERFCPYIVSVIKQVIQRKYDDEGKETEQALVESKVYLKCTIECRCFVGGKCTYVGAVN